MDKLPNDHIWALLVAFLASLGCYTAIAMVGGSGQVLENVVVALAGGLAGLAVGSKIGGAGK